MRTWILGWVGTAVLGVVNGATREALYADAVGEDVAGAISTGTLLGLLAGYIWLLERHRPLADRREAVTVGVAWAALTVAFEFGFGHWVAGDSWSTLLESYDVAAGELWPLVPAAMLVGPELARRLAARDLGASRQTQPAS